MISRTRSRAERQKVPHTAQLLHDRPQLVVGSRPSPSRTITRCGPRHWQRFPLDTIQRARAIDKPRSDAGGGGSHGKRSSEPHFLAVLLGGFFPTSFQPHHWLPACPSASHPVSGHVWRWPYTKTDRESSGPTGTDRYRPRLPRNALFSESSGCMAENRPRSVQQRATGRFGCISCNTPRQAGANSECQRLRMNQVELDFSAYPQVPVNPSNGHPKLRTLVRFPSPALDSTGALEFPGASGSRATEEVSRQNLASLRRLRVGRSRRLRHSNFSDPSLLLTPALRVDLPTEPDCIERGPFTDCEH